MEKKINETTLLNVEGTYRALQPFETVEELNANTKAIRELYADQMTRSTYDVLDVLSRYACKFAGVCFLAKTKIASMLGITRQTVIRACKALEALGVIVQHETRRQGGDRRQSTNAIVFVSVETAPVTPDITPACYAIDTPLNTPINTNTVNTNDTVRQDFESDGSQVVKAVDNSEGVVDPTDKTHLKPSLPDGWYEEAAPYAQDFDDLYAITGVLFKGKHGTDLRVEDHAAEFGEVLRKAWLAVKHGRVQRTAFYGYLYAGFKRTAHNIAASVKARPLFDFARDYYGVD